MIYSWTLTNATITAEWMHPPLYKAKYNLVTPLTTTSWKKTYYDTAPRLLIRYSQRFKQTRLAVFRWTVTFCNLQSMWNLSKEKKKKKKKLEKFKCRQLLPSNFGTELSKYSEHGGQKGRQRLCYGRNLKVQWEEFQKNPPNKQRENPTELSRDPWSTRKGKREMRPPGGWGWP